MSNLLPSLVRTLVPLLVTLIGPWVATNLGVDSETLAGWLGVLVSAVVYAAVRVLETRVSPKFGWLLGWATQPAYGSTLGRHEAGADVPPPPIPPATGPGGTTVY